MGVLILRFLLLFGAFFMAMPAVVAAAPAAAATTAPAAATTAAPVLPAEAGIEGKSAEDNENQDNKDVVHTVWSGVGGLLFGRGGGFAEEQGEHAQRQNAGDELPRGEDSRAVPEAELVDHH